MKNLYFLTYLVLFCSTLFSQSPFFRVGYMYNLDVWKPYTEVTKSYINDGGIIFSNTWNISIEIPVYSSKKYSFYTGLSYQQVNHVIKDHILSQEYPWSGGIFYYSDPPDLISESKRVGLILGFDYLTYEKKLFSTYAGISSEIYLMDFYNSYYETNDYTPFSFELDGPKPKSFRIYQKYPFRFSTMNLSAHYRLVLMTKIGVSFGFKINVGANLYTDWDQFKRYGWLGLGLEMGFGRKKVNEKVVD